METRQERGKEIAQTMGKLIKKTKDGWLVPSQSSNAMYRVDELFNCNCPDCQKRSVTCKHGYALRYYLQAENAAGQVVHKQRLTIGQAWSAYNAGQTSEIRLFDELLKDLVQEVEEPEQAMGRPRLALREQVFCSIQKVYSQLSSRRAASLFGNAMAKGQIRHAPHFNAPSKLLNKAEITPLLQHLLAVTASPLRSVESSFAVDSSGFRTTCFGQYAEQKYALERQHNWLKAHICIGTKTNIVVGAIITDENGADCPQFAPLIQTTTNNGFTVLEASADKAYSSRANYEVVNALGGQAYIPFKSNTSGKAVGSMLWKKMFHYFQMNQTEFYEHYHARSNVESTFAAIKRKFGDTVKSKNPIAQQNELLCKLIAYNLTVVIQEMHELGIQPDFCTQSPRGEPKVA